MKDIFTSFEKEEKKKKRPFSQARLQYYEQKLTRLQRHLKQKTYPKSIRVTPSPKMKTLKGQALIREACDEVKQILLLQMMNETQQTLAQEQKKKPKTNEEKQSIQIKALQKELNDLRAELQREKDIKSEYLLKGNQSIQDGELNAVSKNISE